MKMIIILLLFICLISSVKSLSCVQDVDCPGDEYCNAQGICVECESNNECLDACTSAGRCGCDNNSDCSAGYVCDVNFHYCVQSCAENVDCFEDPARPKCVNGACVECKSDNHCPTEWGYCNLEDNSCTETCLGGANSECDSVVSIDEDRDLFKCSDSGSFPERICVECKQTSHCPDPEHQVCNLMTGKCDFVALAGGSSPTTTTTSSSPTPMPGCSPACSNGLQCDLTDSTCKQCLNGNDSDCAGELVCSDAGNCVECFQNNQCTGNKAFCKLDTGVCVHCRTASDCAFSSEICANDNKCYEACAKNSDCDVVNGVCNLQLGYCVDCLSNNDCGNQVCDLNTYKCRDQCNNDNDCADVCVNAVCVRCRANSDCDGTDICDANRCVAPPASVPPTPMPTPGCVQMPSLCTGGLQCRGFDNRCVECLSTSECAGELYCSPAGFCVECELNEDCINNNRPYCETGSGVCVACRSNSDCFSGEVCNAEKQCVTPCSTDGQCNGDVCNANGICVECTATKDDNCFSGEVCDEATFKCKAECTSDNDCNNRCDLSGPSGKCVRCLANNDCDVGEECTSTKQCRVAAQPTPVPPTPVPLTTPMPVPPTPVTTPMPTPPFTTPMPSPPPTVPCNGQCGVGEMCLVQYDVCAECGDDDDCPSDEWCDPNNGQCEKCVSDNDCGVDEGCWMPLNKCTDQCSDHNDCSLSTFCSNDEVGADGLCVECTKNSHCGQDETCDKLLGKCVWECFNDNDCDGNDVCHESRCVRCKTTNDCPANKVCTSLFKCKYPAFAGVTTTTSPPITTTTTPLPTPFPTPSPPGVSPTPFPTPFPTPVPPSGCAALGCPTGEMCDANTNVCVQCYSDYDCPGDELCHESGSCVDCLSNGDCLQNELCDFDTGECQECLIDLDCPYTGQVCFDPTLKCDDSCEIDDDCPGSKYCSNYADNQPEGTCVQCVIDNDCGNSEVCDQLRFKCTDKCSGSCANGDVCLEGRCVQCDTDDDCDGRRICDEYLRCRLPLLPEPVTSTFTPAPTPFTPMPTPFTPAPPGFTTGAPTPMPPTPLPTPFIAPTPRPFNCVYDRCRDPTQLCNTQSGFCVDCLQDFDCPFEQYCSNSGNCVQCTIDDDCYGICVNNLCVDCLSDEDCPYYDQSCMNEVCVDVPTPAPVATAAGCQNHFDCPGEDVCEFDTGICRECVLDDDCADDSFCSSLYACELLETTCFDAGCEVGVCSDDGVCVDCLFSSDCALATDECVDNVCVMAAVPTPPPTRMLLSQSWPLVDSVKSKGDNVDLLVCTNLNVCTPPSLVDSGVTSIGKAISIQAPNYLQIPLNKVGNATAWTLIADVKVEFSFGAEGGLCGLFDTRTRDAAGADLPQTYVGGPGCEGAAPRCSIVPSSESLDNGVWSRVAITVDSLELSVAFFINGISINGQAVEERFLDFSLQQTLSLLRDADSSCRVDVGSLLLYDGVLSDTNIAELGTTDVSLSNSTDISVVVDDSNESEQEEESVTVITDVFVDGFAIGVNLTRYTEVVKPPARNVTPGCLYLSGVVFRVQRTIRVLEIGAFDWGSPGVGVRAGDNFGYAFVAPMRGGSLNAVEIDADRFVSKTLRSQKGKEGIRVLSRVSGDLILSAGDTVVLMATSEAPLRTLSADPTYDCAAKCADANNTDVIGSDSWCDCCLHCREKVPAWGNTCFKQSFCLSTQRCAAKPHCTAPPSKTAPVCSLKDGSSVGRGVSVLSFVGEYRVDLLRDANLCVGWDRFNELMKAGNTPLPLEPATDGRAPLSCAGGVFTYELVELFDSTPALQATSLKPKPFESIKQPKLICSGSPSTDIAMFAGVAEDTSTSCTAVRELQGGALSNPPTLLPLSRKLASNDNSTTSWLNRFWVPQDTLRGASFAWQFRTLRSVVVDQLALLDDLTVPNGTVVELRDFNKRGKAGLIATVTYELGLDGSTRKSVATARMVERTTLECGFVGLLSVHWGNNSDPLMYTSSGVNQQGLFPVDAAQLLAGVDILWQPPSTVSDSDSWRSWMRHGTQSVWPILPRLRYRETVAQDVPLMSVRAARAQVASVAMHAVTITDDGQVYTLDAPTITVLSSSTMQVVRSFKLAEPLSAVPGVYSKGIKSIAVVQKRLFAIYWDPMGHYQANATNTEAKIISPSLFHWDLNGKFLGSIDICRDQSRLCDGNNKQFWSRLTLHRDQRALYVSNGELSVAVNLLGLKETISFVENPEEVVLPAGDTRLVISDGVRFSVDGGNLRRFDSDAAARVRLFGDERNQRALLSLAWLRVVKLSTAGERYEQVEYDHTTGLTFVLTASKRVLVLAGCAQVIGTAITDVADPTRARLVYRDGVLLLLDIARIDVDFYNFNLNGTALPRLLPSRYIQLRIECLGDRYGPLCRNECSTCDPIGSSGCDKGRSGSGACICNAGFSGPACAQRTGRLEQFKTYKQKFAPVMLAGNPTLPDEVPYAAGIGSEIRKPSTNRTLGERTQNAIIRMALLSPDSGRPLLVTLLKQATDEVLSFRRAGVSTGGVLHLPSTSKLVDMASRGKDLVSIEQSSADPLAASIVLRQFDDNGGVTEQRVALPRRDKLPYKALAVAAPAALSVFLSVQGDNRRLFEVVLPTNNSSTAVVKTVEWSVPPYATSADIDDLYVLDRVVYILAGRLAFRWPLPSTANATAQGRVTVLGSLRDDGSGRQLTLGLPQSIYVTRMAAASSFDGAAPQPTGTPSPPRRKRQAPAPTPKLDADDGVPHTIWLADSALERVAGVNSTYDCFDGFFGVDCTACTCHHNAVCNDKRSGDGVCTCSNGFAPTRATANSTKPTCESCPPGYELVNIDTDQPDSKYVENKSKCRACRIGSFSPDGSGCRSVPPGSYQDKEAAVEGKLCAVGDYSEKPGRVECLPCQLGYVAKTIGTTKCSKCPDGFIPTMERDDCVPCAAGKFLPSGSMSSTCLTCPSGHWSAPGAATCTPARPGYYVDAKAVADQELPCPAGQYQPLAGQSRCVRCPSNAVPVNGGTVCVCVPLHYDARAVELVDVSKVPVLFTQNPASIDNALMMNVSAATTVNTMSSIMSMMSGTATMPSMNVNGTTTAMPTSPPANATRVVEILERLLSDDEEARRLAAERYFYVQGLLAGPPVCRSCATQVNGTFEQGFTCSPPNPDVDTIGAGHIYTLPGHWRSTDAGYGATVYQCLSQVGCLGFKNDSTALQTRYGQCREGHEGILCSQCIDNWFELTEGECAPCPPSRASSIVAVVFVAIGMIILLILLLMRDFIVEFTKKKAAVVHRRVSSRMGSLRHSMRNSMRGSFRSGATPQQELDENGMTKSEAATERRLDKKRADETEEERLARRAARKAERDRKVEKMNAAEENYDEAMGAHENVDENAQQIWASMEGSGSVSLFSTAKLKIAIGFAQVASAFRVTYPDVPWPSIFSEIANKLQFINLGIVQVSTVECIASFNYYSELLFKTIAPIVVFILIPPITLFVLWTVRRCRSMGTETLVRDAMAIALRTCLLFAMIIFTGASASLFQLFNCKQFGSGHYLLVDLSLECGSGATEWQSYLIYGAFMIALYTVGVPLFAFAMVYKHRNELEEPLVMKRYGQVYLDFDLSRNLPRYWEPIDMVRRILLTSVLVVFGENAATQVAVALLISVVALVAHVGVAPYDDFSDQVMQFVALALIALNFFTALLLKVSTPIERDDAIGFAWVIALIDIIVMIMAAILIVLQLMVTAYRFGCCKCLPPLPCCPKTIEEEEEEEEEERAKQDFNALDLEFDSARAEKPSISSVNIDANDNDVIDSEESDDGDDNDDDDESSSNSDMDVGALYWSASNQKKNVVDIEPISDDSDYSESASPLPAPGTVEPEYSAPPVVNDPSSLDDDDDDDVDASDGPPLPPPSSFVPDNNTDEDNGEEKKSKKKKKKKKSKK